ncbi:hypothetical protein D3C81_2285890 [compost metagenome]
MAQKVFIRCRFLISRNSGISPVPNIMLNSTAKVNTALPFRRCFDRENAASVVAVI